MTDRLSDALHHEAARVPAVQRPPGQIRRAAEHHRRIRRGGAVAVVALAAVLSVASVVTGPWGGTARPAPADSPSPNVTGTRMFSLAAQPTLTEADWERIIGGGVKRLSAPPEMLTYCVHDPRLLGDPTHAYGTAYRAPDQGRQKPLTEYVMRYSDEAAAVQAYADVYSGFHDCSDPATDAANWVFPPFSKSLFPSDLRLDEMFAVEVSGTRKSGGYYELIAARERNVVIVIELSGWGDRPSNTAQIAMMRAIPSKRVKCGTHPTGNPGTGGACIGAPTAHPLGG
jgi:hypothetical protein